MSVKDALINFKTKIDSFFNPPANDERDWDEYFRNIEIMYRKGRSDEEWEEFKKKFSPLFEKPIICHVGKVKEERMAKIKKLAEEYGYD